MPTPAPWENFGGRADGGLIATQMPDLTLRMAEETVRLKLPAQLIPGLLTFATQDFWHDVDSRFPDDWPAHGAAGTGAFAVAGRRLRGGAGRRRAVTAAVSEGV